MTLKQQLIIKLTPVILLLLLFITIYTQYTARNQAVQNAYLRANSIAAEESTHIQQIVSEALGRTEDMAAMNRLEYNSGKVSREQIMNIVHASFEAAPKLAGMSACWLDIDGKNAELINTKHGNNKGMLGAYWSRNNQGQLTYAQLDNFQNEPYFTLPIKAGRSILTDPYVDNTSGHPIMMVTISSPISINGNPIAVATADISLENLSTLIKNITPYQTGYAFVVSEKGTILAHPNPELIGKDATLLPSVDKQNILKDLQSKEHFEYDLVLDGSKEKVITSLNSFTLIEGERPWFFGVVLPREKVLAEATEQLYLTLGICVIGILISLGLLFVVANSITKPLQKLVNTANEIAKGNYSNKGDSTASCREINELNTALDSMLENLLHTLKDAENSKNIAETEMTNAKQATEHAEQARMNAEEGQKKIFLAAEHIENVSTRLSTAAEQLSAQVETVKQSVADQRLQLADSASAMAEMNSTVVDVAHNASNAANSSSTAKTNALQGSEIVHTSINSMQIVQKNTEELYKEMSTLGKQAESIGTIITVIDDIADQTNLLALNAAIEAARAGEAGRGFAVVADEVRKLAEKTISATSEVGNAISTIQQLTERSIRAMETTTNNLSKATEQVRTSGDSLSNIVNATEQTAVQISSIATAVEEQSATSQHIGSSLDHISKQSEHMVQTMNESSQAVIDLAHQAQELESLVANLRKSNA
ncbi:methyl-accepting chemotaxis protein [Desulfovibrio litoralis]|uniref:Methyl-accepting chemotaxis protein n=1 Tax=Desulfovibrio litoralis DSM 11393 TaxID=1121455 RepID=A0A1M7SSC4_9BACT|nr:methyl-accepting chemotaxis protein [Desulfovibrio litoralis]SHN61290.1 methyl-accepting chemotaxis protein [Desulfovibrio litoralis DSM 11393]